MTRPNRSYPSSVRVNTRGLPIRVLIRPGVRLPEDAFLGVADLEIVASRGVEEDAEQVRAWIVESTREGRTGE